MWASTILYVPFMFDIGLAFYGNTMSPTIIRTHINYGIHTYNVQLLMKMDGNNETQRRGLDGEAMQKGQQVRVKICMHNMF